MTPLLGTATQQRSYENIPYKLDGKDATISAKVFERKASEFRNIADFLDTTYGNPVKLMQDPKKLGEVLPTANLVRHSKVKYFIDGLYAAVEEALVQGNGLVMSKDEFIRKVYNRAISAKEDKGANEVLDNAVVYLAASMKIMGEKVKIPRDLTKEVDEKVSRFLDDKIMSTPLAFYNWTKLGQQIFRRDRYLQNPPSRQTIRKLKREPKEGLDKAVLKFFNSIISEEADLRTTYQIILKLYEKMSNPYEEVDALFPPVRLQDQGLFKGLMSMGLKGNLGKALAQAVRTGEISFKPENDSGLYTRQMWEIIPWVTLDVSEFKKFIPDEKYRELLETDFIAAWAGTRETHIKVTGPVIGYCPGLEPPKKIIYVSPELNIEPIATTYQRIGESLDFVRDSLNALFGARFLEKVYRYKEDGTKSDKPISQELDEMVKLMRGLEFLSKEDIHFKFDIRGNSSLVENARSWLENLDKDRDMNRDCRLIVPIIGKPDGSAYINYIVMGYRPVEIDIEYKNEPKIQTARGIGVYFQSHRYFRPTLEFIEVAIPKEKGQFTNPEIRKLAMQSKSIDKFKEILTTGGVVSLSVK